MGGPGGLGGPGEAPLDAVRREVEEETGWLPARSSASTYFALNGIGEMRFTLYLVTGAAHIGDPEDISEAARVDWVPWADIPRLVQTREITDGPTQMALGHHLGIHSRLSPPL